jgi:hypothetical protein
MLLTTFTSCILGSTSNKSEEDESFRAVHSTISDLAISFPSSWDENLEMNEEATIGMLSSNNRQSFVVIEEPISDFADDMSIQDYGDIILENMKDMLSDAETGAEGWVETSIGDGIPAMQIFIKGTMEKIKFSYLVTVFKESDEFCQAVACTSQSDYDDSEALFKKILSTAEFSAS